jgi:hypothetical protein
MAVHARAGQQVVLDLLEIGVADAASFHTHEELPGRLRNGDAFTLTRLHPATAAHHSLPSFVEAAWRRLQLEISCPTWQGRPPAVAVPLARSALTTGMCWGAHGRCNAAQLNAHPHRDTLNPTEIPSEVSVTRNTVKR